MSKKQGSYNVPQMGGSHVSFPKKYLNNVPQK